MNIRKFDLLSLFFLSSLYLAGCGSLRQEVNPDRLNREAEKLVVSCFISPQDTVLAARVSLSSPVLGVSNPSHIDISNATVVLSDGSQSVPLFFTAGPKGGNSFYRADARLLPIVVGKSYTLTVQIPDGRQVTATCSVPEPVSLERIAIDSASITDFGLSRKDYHVRLYWRDPAGRVNFYRVAGNNEYTSRSRYYTGPGVPLRDTVYYTTGSVFFEPSSVTNDQGNDGQAFISGRGRLSLSYSWTNGKQDPSYPTRLNAYLLATDINYYQYHDAVERQNQSGDNPFAEPVPIPSNVQGGLGCFGAYNRSTLTINLK
jgi:Domain of unknown function (DUF4249)